MAFEVGDTWIVPLPAARREKETAIKCLLDKKANPDAKNKRGQTLLDFCQGVQVPEMHRHLGAGHQQEVKDNISLLQSEEDSIQRWFVRGLVCMYKVKSRSRF